MKSPVPPLDTAELVWLLHAAPVGILIQDSEGRISWVNDTLAGQLGLQSQNLVGRSVSELPLEATEVRSPSGEIYYRPPASGVEEKWLARLEQRLESEDGGLVSFYRDVTEEEGARIQVDRLRQALLGQLSTDDRTGLLSRRAVMIQLEAQVSRSRRYNNPLSVVLVRLKCGSTDREEISEQGVVRFSRVLRDQTRWPDIIGRWDKREFILVLPETSASATGALTEKVKKQAGSLAGQDREAGCAVSLGVTEWRKGDDAESLIERVEANLVSQAS